MAVDYEALAKKHGGQSGGQAQPPTPDYKFLAEQAGGSLVGEIPQRTGVDAVTQYLGVINQAIAPYVAAGTAGAVAGAPFGGVGAFPGAAVGAGALGITDLSATLFNLGAQAAGAETRLPLASQVIREKMQQVAPPAFREPETPAQRLTSVGAEAGVSALTQANMLRSLAKYVNPRTQINFPGGPISAKETVTAMGTAPGAQTAAATGGALAQQAVVEKSKPDSFARNPLVLALAGFLGGSAAGRLVLRGPQNVRAMFGKEVPSEAQVYQQAKDDYKLAEQAGVVFKPAAYDRMLQFLNKRLIDEGYTDQPAITAALNKLNKFQGQARSFIDLDTARSDITKTLIKSSDENVRRLGREIADHLDEFIDGAQPTEILAGNIPQAVSALGRARESWRQVSRSEEMSELLRRATLSEGSLDAAIRNEFRNLAKNQKRLQRFSPSEQDFILDVVQGGRFADKLSRFSEALRVERSLGGTLYLGTGGLATPFAAPVGQIDVPTALAVMTGITGARAGTGAMANFLAAQRAKDAAAAMRGFRRVPVTPLALPVAETTVRPGVNFLRESEILSALSGR